MFVNYWEILEKPRGVNSVLYTELTPRSFSNISRLFTNIQFVSSHKSKYNIKRIWWKTHLFCKRHFLIRSIVWSLFWYEVSPKNYDFLVLVLTFKLSTWSKNIFHKKDASFIVVSIHVKKKLVSEKKTCKFVNNWDISNYRILPNLPHKYFFEYFSVVYKHTVCFFI